LFIKLFKKKARVIAVLTEESYSLYDSEKKVSKVQLHLIVLWAWCILWSRSRFICTHHLLNPNDDSKNHL